ncbi:MAG: hypothetical protein HPY79_07850 [Bacteroidales bacterium]|nr:hypothetical protein [Bacteroidales bacterium]
MAKWIFNIVLLLLITLAVKAQDESRPEASIIREISTDNKIISYLEIRDSAIAVLDLLKEKWGETEEINGKLTWNNVTIDSIEAKIRVELYHGFFKNGNFKVCVISKNEKIDEKRVLRLRFLQKDNDLLSSMQTSQTLKNYFNRLLEEVSEEVKEDNEVE